MTFNEEGFTTFALNAHIWVELITWCTSWDITLWAQFQLILLLTQRTTLAIPMILNKVIFTLKAEQWIITFAVNAILYQAGKRGGFQAFSYPIDEFQKPPIRAFLTDLFPTLTTTALLTFGYLAWYTPLADFSCSGDAGTNPPLQHKVFIQTYTLPFYQLFIWTTVLTDCPIGSTHFTPFSLTLQAPPSNIFVVPNGTVVVCSFPAFTLRWVVHLTIFTALNGAKLTFAIPVDLKLLSIAFTYNTHYVHKSSTFSTYVRIWTLFTASYLTIVVICPFFYAIMAAALVRYCLPLVQTDACGIFQLKSPCTG